MLERELALTKSDALEYPILAAPKDGRTPITLTPALTDASGDAENRAILLVSATSASCYQDTGQQANAESDSQGLVWVLAHGAIGGLGGCGGLVLQAFAGVFGFLNCG